VSIAIPMGRGFEARQSVLDLTMQVLKLGLLFRHHGRLSIGLNATLGCRFRTSSSRPSVWLVVPDSLAVPSLLLFQRLLSGLQRPRDVDGQSCPLTLSIRGIASRLLSVFASSLHDSNYLPYSSPSNTSRFECSMSQPLPSLLVHAREVLFCGYVVRTSCFCEFAFAAIDCQQLIEQHASSNTHHRKAT
jgi:hypothetical protein